jgi:DNA-binding winged helix-turn-helix (wHTH) protein
MAHETRHPRIYQFGPFRLDAGKHILWEDGRKVRLSLRPMEVLLVLVERAGEVVTPDDWIYEVWGDTTVVRNNVTQQIHVLRNELDETPGTNKYIETVPRDGYKFVAQVKIVPTPNGGPNVEGDRDIAGVRAGGKAGDSIVVLCEDDPHLVDWRGTVIRVGDTIMLDDLDEAGDSCPSRARVFRCCPNSNELLDAQQGHVVGLLKLDIRGNFVVVADARADRDHVVKVTIVGGRGKIPGAPVVDGTGKVLIVPVLPAAYPGVVIPNDLMKSTESSKVPSQPMARTAKKRRCMQ